MAGFLRKKARNDPAKNQAVSSPSPPASSPLFARFNTSSSAKGQVVVSGPMSLSASRRDSGSVHGGRHGRKDGDSYTAFRRTATSNTSNTPARAPQPEPEPATPVVEASNPQPVLPNLEFDPQGRHSPLLIDLPPEIALFQEFGDSLFNTPPESLNSKPEDVPAAFSPHPPTNPDMGVNFSSVAHGDLVKDFRVSLRTSPNGSSDKRISPYAVSTSPPPLPPQRAPASPPIPPTSMSSPQPPKTPSKKQKALPHAPSQPSTSPPKHTASMAIPTHPQPPLPHTHVSSRPSAPFNHPSAPVPIPGPYSTAMMMGTSSTPGGPNNLTMAAGSSRPRIFAAMDGATGGSGNHGFSSSPSSFRHSPEKAYPSPPAEHIMASSSSRPPSRHNSAQAHSHPQQPQFGTQRRIPSVPHQYHQQAQPQHQAQQQGRELTNTDLIGSGPSRSPSSVLNKSSARPASGLGGTGASPSSSRAQSRITTMNPSMNAPPPPPPSSFSFHPSPPVSPPSRPSSSVMMNNPVNTVVPLPTARNGAPPTPPKTRNSVAGSSSLSTPLQAKAELPPTPRESLYIHDGHASTKSGAMNGVSASGLTIPDMFDSSNTATTARRSNRDGGAMNGDAPVVMSKMDGNGTALTNTASASPNPGSRFSGAEFDNDRSDRSRKQQDLFGGGRRKGDQDVLDASASASTSTTTVTATPKPAMSHGLDEASASSALDSSSKDKDKSKGHEKEKEKERKEKKRDAKEKEKDKERRDKEKEKDNDKEREREERRERRKEKERRREERKRKKESSKASKSDDAKRSTKGVSAKTSGPVVSEELLRAAGVAVNDIGDIPDDDDVHDEDSVHDDVVPQSKRATSMTENESQSHHEEDTEDEEDEEEPEPEITFEQLMVTPHPLITDLLSREKRRINKKGAFTLADFVSDAELLQLLLEYLGFYDWCLLASVSRVIRVVMVQKKDAREEILERFLSGTIGYRRWSWDEPEPLSLSLQDLSDYMRGVSTPTHEYARIANIYTQSLSVHPHARDPNILDTVRALTAATRAYTRVVLRLRAQAEKEEAVYLAMNKKQQTMNVNVGVYGSPYSSPYRSGTSSRAPSPTYSSFSHSQHHLPQSRTHSPSLPPLPKQHGITFRSPLFRLRRAPLLRVFVPSPDGDWLSDRSVLECEAECRKAGVLRLLRMGDVIWDIAVGDEGNVGRLIWDGSYLIDLDYTYSSTGELPKYMPTLAFPPSYFHRVIRPGSTSSNPIVQIDLALWGEEIAANLQLLQDRVRTETPQGAYHNVVRWVHRSSFLIRPPSRNSSVRTPPSSTHGHVNNVNPPKVPAIGRILIPGTDNLYVDPGWYGTIVVETEGTNESLADLQDRCGPGVFPPRVRGAHAPVTQAQVENRKVFRIMRERSRPGEIWIKCVSVKERLL